MATEDRIAQLPAGEWLMRVWPGHPYPLGATWDGVGTNFAIFSEHATKVELCLFDDAGKEERLKLPESTAHCWHGYVRGVGPGQRYGSNLWGGMRKWQVRPGDFDYLI